MTAQRVSRGFHRLGFFIAAALFLIAGALAVGPALQKANDASEEHQKLLCAHKYFGSGELRKLILSKAILTGPFTDLIPLDNRELSFKALDCSSSDIDTVRYGEARDPPSFNWLDWLGVFAPLAAIPLGLALVVSLGVYTFIRAIGWVIGGFAAS